MPLPVLVIVLIIKPSTIRSWMLQAYELAMHTGEWVFLFVTQEPSDIQNFHAITDKSFVQTGDASDAAAREAFKSLFIVRSSSQLQYN